MSIRVWLSGGLGNQIFQFAAAKALSLKLNKELILDISHFAHNQSPTGVKRQFELNLFQISDPMYSTNSAKRFFAREYTVKVVPNFILDKLGIHVEKSPFHFSPIQMSKTKISLRGYFQDPTYFCSHESKIRTEFSTLRFESVTFLNLRSAICSAPESVCVHVRRGDYITNAKSQAFHGSPDLSYYARTIQTFLNNGNKYSFFIFSDDVDWCKEHLSFIPNCRFVSGDGLTSAETLLAMATCHHFIISNSTFSWWASWLGLNPQKRIFAPKNWTNELLTNSLSLGKKLELF